MFVAKAIRLAPIDGFLGGGIDLVAIAPDQGAEGTQQIVVEPLVAVVDEAQQIQVDRLAVHALELVDCVVLDQGGVLAHALGGQLE
jgi:hypothetical protein